MKILAIGDFQGNFPSRLVKKIKKEEFDAIVGVGDYGGISNWRPWVMQNLRSSKAGKPYLTAEEYFGKKKLKKLIMKDDFAAKNVLRRLTRFGKPVISVFGNGDDGWYHYKYSKGLPPSLKEKRRFLRRLKAFKDITYGQAMFGGKSFIGFGGYMDIDAYFDKKTFKDAEDVEKCKMRIDRREKSKSDLFKRLRKIGKNKEPIFVLHYPPQGAFDIIRDKKDNPMNGKSAGIGFFTDAIRQYRPLLVLCGHMHEYQGAKRIGRTIVVNPGDAEKGKYAIVEVEEKNVRVKLID